MLHVAQKSYIFMVMNVIKELSAILHRKPKTIESNIRILTNALDEVLPEGGPKTTPPINQMSYVMTPEQAELYQDIARTIPKSEPKEPIDPQVRMVVSTRVNRLFQDN